MRTVKKSLCLVLALIFVLGLCTIGSNAGFAKYTDMDKVNYEEAVEVLTGLGVIEGYPDGSFEPTASVTRAEAAAMIARMMLGREKADKLPIGEVKFTDVPETNWAAKYIAFCANKGIIVGMGDGTFHPSENVTGTQMATMLLRALGYGVMGEYEGKGWDINAVADALYYKVFEDSKVEDFNNAATREETALYVWNTMWIQLVGYDVDLNYYDGRTYREYVDTYGGWVYRPLTFAKDAFNLVKWDYAQVMANQATGEDYTVVRLVTGYTPAKDADGKEIKGQVVPVYEEIYLDTETDLDLIGHEVTIYFKDEIKEDKTNHIDYYEIFFLRDESTVLRGYVDFSSYDDLYRVLKSANKNNLKVDFADVMVWTNYDYETAAAINFGMGMYDWDGNGWYTTVADLKGQKSTMDSLAWYTMFGTAYGTWILDHEGMILLVLRDSYNVAEVKAVDKDHEEVELHIYKSGKYDDEIFDFAKGDIQLVYDGIAKGDYVVVQPVGSLTYIKPTGTETLDITERASSVDLLTFASIWNFNSSSMNADTYGLGIYIEDQDDPEDVGVGDSVLFYTITGSFGTKTYFGLQILEKAKSAGIVYVNYKQEAIAAGDWDYIKKPDEDGDLETGKFSTVLKVQCITQDGEEVVYKVKKTQKDMFDALTKGVYEVFVRGAYATFTPVADSYMTKTAGRNSYMKNDQGVIYYVTSDTKVIYINGEADDLDIVVASKLVDKDPAEDYTVYTVAKKSGGNYKLNTVWVPGGVEAPEDYSDSYMYLTAGTDGYHSVSGYEEFDDEEDPYYTVYIDGVSTRKVHIMADTKYYKGDKILGGFYKFLLDDDGFYEIAAVDAKYVEYDMELTKGMVKRDGSKYRLYTENSDGIELKVEVVDTSAKTTTETKTDAAVNSLERLEELLGEGYTITVDYMFTLSADKVNEIPTGVMYVTGVVPPAED